jgi:hypothetical protein
MRCIPTADRRKPMKFLAVPALAFVVAVLASVSTSFLLGAENLQKLGSFDLSKALGIDAKAEAAPPAYFTVTAAGVTAVKLGRNVEVVDRRRRHDC